MESTNQNDPQEVKIQVLLGNYLASSEFNRMAHRDTGHLDEDSLAAFVDGRVSEREARPMIRHLVDCSPCRHFTAELVRLDAAFAEHEAVTTQPASKEPSRVSEALSGILERIFGSNDAAVFAHSEETDEKDADDLEPPRV